MCRKNDMGGYWLGNIEKLTHENNSSDKGRNGTAGKKPATLDIVEVAGIKTLLERGVSTRKVASLMGTSQRTVMRVKKGEYRCSM